MKISIITTIYKAEKDLPRLLDSMMAQHNPCLEFFLIDNGSPDRCGDICREYAKKDSRFTLYTLNENIGYIRARNLGLQLCNGDFIGFCDSDDFLEPFGYDHAAEIIQQYNCDFYATAYRTLSDSSSQVTLLPVSPGIYHGNQISEQILPVCFGPINGSPMLHGFVWKHIYRKKIILDHSISFLEPLKPYEDQVFNLDVINQCSCVYIDDHVLYNYIINEHSITAQLTTNFDPAAEWTRILSLYTEKKLRASASNHIEALSNQTISFIYSLALNSTKCHRFTISEMAARFFRWESVGLFSAVSSQCSNTNSFKLNFIRYCLAHRQYFFMFFVINAALKFRKV